MGEKPVESSKGEGISPGTKHNSARRRLLKSLAAGGSAVAATQVLPERWIKPVVDAIVVPAYAQVSGASMSVTLALRRAGTDNNSPDYQSFTGPGTFAVTKSKLTNDAMLVDGQATLIPPANPGQLVTFSLSVQPSGADTSFGPNPPPVLSNPTTGFAAFSDSPFFATDGVQPVSDATNITGTFSAPGYPNTVITITF